MKKITGQDWLLIITVAFCVAIFAVALTSCKQVVQPDPVKIEVAIKGDTATGALTDSVLVNLQEGDSIVFRSATISDEVASIVTDENGQAVATNTNGITHKVTGKVKRVNGKLVFTSTTQPLIVRGEVLPRTFRVAPRLKPRAVSDLHSRNWQSEATMLMYIGLGLVFGFIAIAYLRKWRKDKEQATRV